MATSCSTPSYSAAAISMGTPGQQKRQQHRSYRIRPTAIEALDQLDSRREGGHMYSKPLDFGLIFYANSNENFSNISLVLLQKLIPPVKLYNLYEFG